MEADKPYVEQVPKHYGQHQGCLVCHPVATKVAPPMPAGKPSTLEEAIAKAQARARRE